MAAVADQGSRLARLPTRSDEPSTTRRSLGNRLVGGPVSNVLRNPCNVPPRSRPDTSFDSCQGPRSVGRISVLRSLGKDAERLGDKRNTVLTTCLHPFGRNGPLRLSAGLSPSSELPVPPPSELRLGSQTLSPSGPADAPPPHGSSAALRRPYGEEQMWDSSSGRWSLEGPW